MCAVVFAALGATLLVMRRRWLRGFIIALIAFGVGLGAFALHYTRTVQRARALDGQTLELRAELLDYPRESEDYCSARILITGDGLPRLQARLYGGAGSLAGLVPGQTLSFTGKLSAADMRYGESYDYYNSCDVYFTVNAKSAVSAAGEGGEALFFPQRLARGIKSTVERIFPPDVAAFMQALLAGDKSAMYEDNALQLAFSRSGFMHVVAVSGMHIAFLVGMLQLIFGATRRSALLCIALAWLFAAATGGSPSAVRAAIMQSFLLLAPVFRRENDPITSLSAALALILLANPYAAASVSLQLSFAAMAGILCFSEKINAALIALAPEGRAKKLLEKPVAVIASSLSVMILTVPLMAVHFGYVPLLSPLTNALGLWAVSLCFCGGCAACALGALFPPLGVAAAWLVAWPARYVFLITRLVSGIPFSAVTVRSGYIKWWLILTYLLFFVAALCRAKAWKKLALPAALSAAALFAAMTAARIEYSACAGVMTALDVGQGQCVCVFSGDKTLMVDCGGSFTGDDAGETAGAYLGCCGRGGVDLLLLTHLHADHANGVTTLLETTRVGRIILPAAPNDEDGTLAAILESAARHGVEVSYLTGDAAFALGGIELRLFAPGEAGDENERCIMALVSIGSYDMLITGDASKSAEKELIAAHDIGGAELLIAGHHGSRRSCCGELLSGLGADTAIISVGYNTYDLPTNETLERLAAYGYNIYRTDLNGTVEIRIGRDYG